MNRAAPIKSNVVSKRVQQIQKLPKKKARASSNSADSTSNAQSPNPQAGSITSIDESPKLSQFFRKRLKDEPSDVLSQSSLIQAKKIEFPPQFDLDTYGLEKIEQKDSEVQ